jgi:hypothetical protein
MTGDDYLPWRVEVHRFDHFTLRSFSARGDYVTIAQPEDRGHCALPCRHGLLHGTAAKTHKLNGCTKIE